MNDAPRLQLASSLPALPTRPDDAHKGDFGRALIVAGSRGMSGAACLAGTAAVRGGAGLVTVAIPQGIQAIVAGFEPSYLTIGLAEDDQGRILSGAQRQLAKVLSRQTAIGVGPGLGQTASLLDLVVEFYSTATQPAVFDADALNLLAQRTYLLKRPPEAPARVITPHVAEFARLSGLTIDAIQADRASVAAEFALRNHIIVVLKGSNTVITDGTRVAVNTTGNSGMATGGTGDVLTGVIVSLLAQGISPFEAAQLGAHLHGMAGDLAAEVLSKPGLIASDLLNYLGRAWRELGQ